MSLRSTPYYHLRLHLLTEAQALEKCSEFILEAMTCKSLFFLNAHCFNISVQNSHYQGALNQADLLLNDGIGIKIGAWLNKTPIKANLNGTDLIPKILSQASLDKKKIFLLGGKPGVAEKAAHQLKKQIPGIEIVGVLDGYIKDPHVIIDAINKSQASVLVVGMGVPLQELFIAQNKEKLSSVKLAIAGGAILDFISGEVPRAPQWLRRLSLEWLYRLLLEPRRLWKRYILGNVEFLYRVVVFKLRTLH